MEKGKMFKVKKEGMFVLCLPSFMYDENPLSSEYKKTQVFRGEYSHCVNSVELPVFFK